MKTSLLRKIISTLIILSMMLSMMLLVGCSKNDKKEKTDPDGGYENKKAEAGRANFIESLGGVSETYEGSVSKEAFDSAEVAATAFVTNEVVGNKKATIESVTSKGELSTIRIAILKLPDNVKEGMLGVEELEVVYSVDESETASTNDVVPLLAAPLNDNAVVVYVIRYENAWKYFVPVPINGKTISRSYYDSVFNEEKYKNCTLKSESSISMDLVATEDGETQNVVIKITMEQLIKYDGKKIYAELYTKIYTSEGGSSNTQEETTYLFIEDRGTYIACYVKKLRTDEWTPTSINKVGFNSIEELTPFYNAYLDYTYFTKTSFGFALENENAKQYFNEALNTLGDVLPSYVKFDDIEIDMYAEYYVANGVLSGARADAVVDIYVAENGVTVDIAENVVVTTTVTDYGTTVVESPNFE